MEENSGEEKNRCKTPQTTGGLRAENNPQTDQEDEFEDAGLDTSSSFCKTLGKGASVVAKCEMQTLKSSPEGNSELPESCQKLFSNLGLWNLYPSKITVPDLLSITSSSLTDKQPRTDSELWPHFVNKLMMVDVNCRYVQRKHTDEEYTSKDTITEDFFSFVEETNETAYEKTHIHPMDVYMAVFHCTNDLARERIIHKISACQFALPLLVPNLLTGQIEVPLYAVQQIKKSWVKTQSETIENVSAFILSAPVPVVSFLRLGMSINSKSQIMNAILNRNKHPTFFNRHCDGSTKTCLLLDGVAEVSWYCPNGRKDNIFQECVSFINLHGDANKHPKQVEFIQEISSVMVVLLPEKHREPEIVESVKRLRETKVPMVLLFTGVEHRSSPSSNQIAAKNRNEAELTKEIVSKVTHVLHEKKVVQSLESHIDKARQRGLIVNKESKEICNGQERAKHLITILGINNKPQGNYNNLLGLKDKYLPLQGDLWNEWSKCDKNVYRLQCRTDMNINQQMTKVESKKNKIRKNQLEKAHNLNNFMAQFFKYALPSTDTSEKIAMLNWLKKYLDDRYTDILTDLHEQFHKTWTKHRQHKAEEKSKAELNNHLTDISGKIKSASFEVHHIMRETAQIYEAIHSSGEFRTVCGFELDSLPELGAEIMMSGCPIELLDGDAKHIPLEWISAVLEKLIENIGDKRVFVISTLGLQSSGKSTLLNAMFGLQFAASAGQCTKGAFMQLVSVHEDLRDDLHFDYVLLVDTEGLRSLETNASKTHDNELATFVVGIGDVTIINIMGENPAEIQDMLQICFHAFLRMTLVQIKPCCFFVHQNIADTAAKNKTQEGRRQLILKLDEISKLVAAAEDKVVSGFSDIIEFDAETHVFYFKNYFDGDPPMAPPNPSYTQNAHALKTKLLSIAKWQDNCKLLLISEVRMRIQHLWNALKKENFVFHFQNSLHIMVYSKLEEHYGKWSWKLRKYALEMQNTLHYKISNDESYDTSTEQFRQDLDNIYQGLKGDVDRYFREEKYPDILVQWRDNIDKRLESLNKELIKETSDKKQELPNNKKYFLKLDQRRRVYEAELLQKSKDLASKLKEEKLNEEELHAHFNTMWTEWETKVAAEKPQEEPRNIQAEVEKVLQGYFQKYWERIFPVKEILCSNVADIVNYSNKIYSKQQVPETVKLVFQRVQEGIDNILAKREKDNFGVNENFIQQMILDINSIIEQFEKSSDIQFTGVFKAQIAVNVCNKAVKNLESLSEKFTRTHDPLVYLNSMKEEYFELFKHFFEGATSVTFFVRYLVKYLAKAALDAVPDKICIKIVHERKSNTPAFSGNRSRLENYILNDLAKKEDFNLYMDYISNPQKVFREFITEHIYNYLACETQLQEMISATWSWFNKQVISASDSATAKLVEKQGNGNASIWLDEFCEKLGGYVAISRMDLKIIEREDIQDTAFLKDYFADFLNSTFNHESAKYEASFKSGPVLFKFRNRPDDILFKQMSGCWEQCPFCKAVCTNSIPDHDSDHSAYLHRPQFLGNLYNQEVPDEYWPEIQIKTENQFCLNFCTSSCSYKFFSAKSETWIPFRDYRKAGPPYNRWNMQGIEGLYWKWFVWTFRSDLEQYYGWKFEGFGEIPKEWGEITKAKALEELNVKG